ncbi:GNAT family N-acetyltransferase [Phaeobacter sp. C3_T13_0]|uniref:GNAT family N-acetyltransferase n=1 Tax=Phaeobacter cretensis TaxID=3342641 RepID=UPI0039BD8F81
MSADLTVKRYTAADAQQWDGFVATSKNATFLLRRGFMEYHADRFADHSLMVLREDTIVALLPASQIGQTLVSHGGLTYGGVLTGPKMSAALMLSVFDSLKRYAMVAGLTELNYKPIPHIYHRQPAEEDLYALFRHGASLVRVDASATVLIGDRLPFGSGKKDGLRKARKAGLTARQSNDWPECWALLTAVLAERHDARPVHSLDEIQRLAVLFPDQIRLFGAYDEDQMISALVIFDCGPAVHVQYIASSPVGRQHGGVDLIVKTLLEEVYSDRKWLDFGISTTDHGMALNEGLAQQKEMFGARTTIYQHYTLDLTA